mmetsp:Transcript_16202/g.21930  ORF Transcript_16202/g.21930 Transcript_16202/m.21930 type:complete len:233 (-) Transcript_16202:1376-2074(-)
MEVKIDIWLLRTDHFRKVLKTHFVAILKLAVIVSLLLDRIIRQVYGHISDIIKGVFTTARPDVSILVAVPFQTAIDAGKEAEASEVELTLMDQKRVVDILLNDESAITFFPHRSPNYLLYFSQCFDDSDTDTAISVFTRFHDPGVLRCPILAFDFFDRLLVVAAHLRIILIIFDCFRCSLLANIALTIIILLDGSLDGDLRIFDFLLHSVVVVLKLPKIGIVDTVLCMESQW